MGGVVLRFDPARADAIRTFARAGGFSFEDRAHAFFLARRPGVTLTAYASGKLLLTGSAAEEYAGVLAGNGLVEPTSPGAPTRARHAGARDAAAPTPRIGSDEAGKGDYFGPLVVAAVLVPDAATEAHLASRGVRDSKTVPDAEAALLGSLVSARCPHAIARLAPVDYNAEHARVGNLNVMLARAHARSIVDLIERHPDARRVTVDRFATRNPVTAALRRRGQEIEVDEVAGAEARDLAVAAASLLARAEFLRDLASLSERWGMRIPKGAGPPVIVAGREFVRRHGADALGQVAKTHFVTTGRIVGHG